MRIGDEKAGKWGYIDKQGKVVIDAQFDDAWSFAEGLAVIRIGGRWGYIDKQGKIAVNPQFDVAHPFVDGLATVRIGDESTGKWGYIDKQGKMVISPQFDDTRSFEDGLAAVRIGDEKAGKWGYIDKQGKMVVDPSLIRPSHLLKGWRRCGLATSGAISVGDVIIELRLFGVPSEASAFRCNWFSNSKSCMARTCLRARGSAAPLPVRRGGAPHVAGNGGTQSAYARQNGCAEFHRRVSLAAVRALEVSVLDKGDPGCLRTQYVIAVAHRDCKHRRFRMLIHRNLLPVRRAVARLSSQIQVTAERRSPIPLPPLRAMSCQCPMS